MKYTSQYFTAEGKVMLAVEKEERTPEIYMELKSEATDECGCYGLVGIGVGTLGQETLIIYNGVSKNMENRFDDHVKACVGEDDEKLQCVDASM